MKYWKIYRRQSQRNWVELGLRHSD
jgi:hypothetical protein